MEQDDFDIHLSAGNMSRATVLAVEALGFVRDEFANNTRCVAVAYHATYRGPSSLPDDELWRKCCDALQADEGFSGCLEEESISDHHRRTLSRHSGEPSPLLPPIHFITVPAGEHKACDLHISVSLDRSTKSAIKQLESLELVSFEKPSAEGVRRVYTATCQAWEDGERLFAVLGQHLDRIPGLHGKMKLEKTIRFLRHPQDAVALPLLTPKAAKRWFIAASELIR